MTAFVCQQRRAVPRIGFIRVKGFFCESPRPLSILAFSHYRSAAASGTRLLNQLVRHLSEM